MFVLGIYNAFDDLWYSAKVYYFRRKYYEKVLSQLGVGPTDISLDVETLIRIHNSPYTSQPSALSSSNAPAWREEVRVSQSRGYTRRRWKAHNDVLSPLWLVAGEVTT